MSIESLGRLEEVIDYRDRYETYVAASAKYIQQFLTKGAIPSFGLVLGSGLGDLADTIKNVQEMPYDTIPCFPKTTAAGHEGTMVFGELEGVPIIGLKGRKHYYEVADEPFNTGMLQCVFPVHVLADLGVQNYFVTNASGGLNQDYAVGDAMIIRSHINTIPNPLLGRKHTFSRVDTGETVAQFEPMNEAYDPFLTALLAEAGQAYGHHVHEGIYMGVTGPSYETEAECIAFRDGLFADAVGMSTTPEVIVARNRGMNVVGMSCITNIIGADGTNATNHDEVKAILESPYVKTRFSSMVTDFFNAYSKKM